MARRSRDLKVSAYRKFIDTLQSELWTATPPKPPKAPKEIPSEPVALPVLDGLGTLDGAPAKVENTVHTTTSPCVPFSARATRGGMEGEPAAGGEHASNPTGDSAVIAPGKWVERVALPASSEPGFTEPWPARRGRIEWQGNMLLHFCSVCGAWGSYGSGVNLRGGSMGQWFCAAHRPQPRKSP
jgi:hypothetical protein